MSGRHKHKALFVLVTILFLWLFAFLATPNAALAEVIRRFEVEISVSSDAVAHVKETITYDFEGAERHSIYRDIPYVYKTNLGNYHAEIDKIEVVNELAEKLQTKISRRGGAENIRIGDPDVSLSGVQTYVISYDVHDAINYFDQYDEFYWNVSGSSWDVVIDEVVGTLNLQGEPATSGAPRNILQASCYRGPLGSGQACKMLQTSSGESESASAWFGDAGLEPGQGITIAIAFPKGFAYQPTKAERAAKTASENLITLLPIALLALMWRLWHTRGRDPEGRVTIAPQYEPPEGMSAIELGGVVDERLQPKDITAEIIQLAAQGYMKIHQIEKKKFLVVLGGGDDYILEKLEGKGQPERDYDRKLLETLFPAAYIKNHELNGSNVNGVALSKLSNKLHSGMSEVESMAYKALADKKYFVRNPNNVRIAYMVVGGLVIGAGVALVLSELIFRASTLAIASVIASGAIVIIFSFFMPARTRLGVLAREHILGLKDYLTTAEKDRLAFHNSPARTPELFDKLLPFAVALGVEKDWAGQFSDIFKGGAQPSWYSGPPGYMFVPASFASDFTQNFSSAVAAASAPQGGSGSGGGGFSGGGFGGGGGGSW